jgi:hypothetical protein
MSGYEIVNVLVALPMNGTTSCVATCRSDKRVLGGGYSSSKTHGASISRAMVEVGTASVYAVLCHC